MPKRSNKKKKLKLTEKMEKTIAFVKEGYSLRRAMLEAGYSPTTAQKKSGEYLRRLDLDELRKGLKIHNAVSGIKAFKVLDDKMDNAEKETDQIKAADAVLRAGRIYLGKEELPTTMTCVFQTFKDTTIDMTPPEKPDEIIDVNSDGDEGDEP